MKDTDLYSRILGLSDPWFVADVELDTAGGRVDVHAPPPQDQQAAPVRGMSRSARSYSGFAPKTAFP